MSSLPTSSNAGGSRPTRLMRQDSSSSDEDGLREALPEELEDLELDQLSEEQIVLDLPAEPLAANEANPHFNGDWEPEQSGMAKKIGLVWSIGIIMYLAAFTVAYVVILASQWRVPCRRHLHMWAVGQVVIQLCMIALKAHLLYFITRYVRAFDTTEPRILRRLSLLYFLNRTLNFVWMSWWLIGTVFRFGKSDCEATSLMSLILVQFIIQWCLTGLLIVALCCSFGCLIVLYFFFPTALSGGERVRGATHAQIAKLPEEKYSPDSSNVKTEDAMCAICLSQYEKGDKLRHLPCRHHFHSECIDQWLLKNKSCPFCKRQIDQEDNPSAPDQHVDEVDDLALIELEHAEDTPLNLRNSAEPSNTASASTVASSSALSSSSGDEMV